MKHRTDFVTNSSSTSYCMVGVEVPSSKIDEIEDIGDLDYNRTYPESDECHLGLPISKMKEDETLADFKKRAVEMLTTIGVDAENADIIVNGYYDG